MFYGMIVEYMCIDWIQTRRLQWGEISKATLGRAYGCNNTYTLVDRLLQAKCTVNSKLRLWWIKYFWSTWCDFSSLNSSLTNYEQYKFENFCFIYQNWMKWTTCVTTVISSMMITVLLSTKVVGICRMLVCVVKKCATKNFPRWLRALRH